MGFLSDVVDIIKSSIDTEELKQNMMSKRYSSIAARASEGTLQFPILISDGMDIDTAQMIVKALERHYATFVQTVLSMNSVSKEGDIAKYLKQFHQNYNDPADKFNTANIIRVFEEGYEVNTIGNNGSFLLSETYNNTNTGAINVANKEQNIDLLEDLRYDILNRKYTPSSDNNIYNFKNKNLSQKYNTVTEKYMEPTESEMTSAARKRNITPTFDGDGKPTGDYAKFRKNYIKNDKYDYNTKHTKSSLDIRSKELRNKKDELEINTVSLPSNMLTDNDVKKANELVATTMHTRLHIVNSNNEPIGVHDFMIGIKGTMHPIRSEEMVTNLVGACKNNNRVFNFLRWTTGEISFFKDFWLNIDEMKFDIQNESSGASRWWIALKNRRTLSKIQSTAFIKDRILPNATIVITGEEAEFIRVHYGYDVTKPYFMKKIMETYYLLGFVIVDSSAQIAHFYFDGSTDFESVSFSGLEKENTRDERKFKEMLKVINRN